MLICIFILVVVIVVILPRSNQALSPSPLTRH